MEHSGSIPLPGVGASADAAGVWAKLDQPAPRVLGMSSIMVMLAVLTWNSQNDRGRIQVLEIKQAVSEERETSRAEAHKDAMTRYREDKRKGEELFRVDFQQSQELHKATLDVLGRALSALPPARR